VAAHVGVQQQRETGVIFGLHMWNATSTALIHVIWQNAAQNTPLDVT